jgi:succinate-semialdehyde dehydrogenase/glutarate-semialdehyde dehydrogenase
MAQIPVRSPRTGEIDMYITPVTTAELDRDCQSLRRCQSAWHGAGSDGRIRVMGLWREELTRASDVLTAALVTDTGRALESASEVQSVIAAVSRWCDLAPELLAEGEPQLNGIAGFHVRRQFVPYALVGVISSWNYPLFLSLVDAIPALAAGCAVIVKPSELTPRFVDPLRKTIQAVPRLRDVFEFVTGGAETGAAIIDQVDAVCFIGSVETGRKVAEAAVRQLIPAFLELGGKDPAIVMESADLAAAAAAIVWAATMNAGQASQSIERVYVAASVCDRFTDLLVANARQLLLTVEGGPIGPIISADQITVIHEQLQEALARGAVARTGGQVEHHGGGAYCRPTVLTSVNHTMRVMYEPTLGPVMAVMPFQTVEEAIELANDSVFGLSAAVFAGSIAEAEAVARRLDVASVSINDAALSAVIDEGDRTPFKWSGLGGSRSGKSALRRFLRQKALLIREHAGSDAWWYRELR